MLQAYSFAGTTMTILVPGAETGGAFTVLHVVKPAGSSTPPHSHDDDTELCYVLEGAAGVETEGRTVTRTVGELEILPPQRPHRLFNAADVTTREFLLCIPAGFDRFVAEAGSPCEPYGPPNPMGPEDRQRLIELAPQFGVRLLKSAEPDGEPAPIEPTAPQSFDLPGGRIDVLARLGDGDDGLVLLRQTLAPGRAVALHRQADAGCLFVVDGALELYRNGRWLTLAKEEAAYIGPNEDRAIRNSTPKAVELLVVTGARFLEELGVAG